MDFSEEWKSLWPVTGQYSSPLLLHHSPPSKRPRIESQVEEDGACEEIGPIVFVPCPETLVQLFSSPSLAPRLPPPYPRLSLAKSIKTSNPFLLSSDASAIASESGPEISEAQKVSYSYLHGFNSLQLLRYKAPGEDESRSYLAFFPSGENCDQIGFFKIGIKDSEMGFGLSSGNQGVLLADDRLNCRILKLLVNPISDDSWAGDSATSSTAGWFTIIGYLMACTMYSVHWYVVKIASGGLGGQSATIEVLGHSLFRNSTVTHACWCPHLNEESIVLLENGELYLFDISSYLEKHSISSNKVKRMKLKIFWCEDRELEHASCGSWLSVEFSWHPRILIVANVRSIFLVDARSEGCNVSCLLRIEMLFSMKNDRFIALCRAGCDAFKFCVASRRLLMLCDVRQPFRPLLKWVHSLDNPRYITIFRLSELRSNTKDDQFRWGAESGSCILLGSFWNCEFSLFIYGPKGSRSVSSEISNFCNTFYAWGLPSEFSMSLNDSYCGDCLVGEEFLKDALPGWIDWRQKKDVVMGFGILDRDPWARLPNADSFGGFTLIRLMSSGKLEALRYQAIWEFGRNFDETHDKKLSASQGDLLYDATEAKYDLQKHTELLILEYLGAYLKGNLDGILLEKINKFHTVGLQMAIKEEIGRTPESVQPTRFGSLSRIFDTFKDVNLPTSVHEISLRIVWAGMPKCLVNLAFSCHSTDLGSPKFESPDASHQMCVSQNPFEMQKVQDSNNFVPPHLLLTIYKLYKEKLSRSRKFGMGETVMLSADDELKRECNRVMEAANEVIRSRTEADSQLHDGYAVSLADNTDEFRTENGHQNNLSFHEPVALLDEVFKVDITLEKSVAGKKKYTTFDKFGTGSKRFTTFLFQKQELDSNVDPHMVGLELLDAGCPLDLKFNDLDISFGPEELKTFKMLKKQDLDFQKGFGLLYQEYLSRATFLNQEK